MERTVRVCLTGAAERFEFSYRRPIIALVATDNACDDGSSDELRLGSTRPPGPQDVARKSRIINKLRDQCLNFKT